MSSIDPHHLKLEGSYNIRDVGGYPTVDGRTTRWKTFVRADRLTALTIESQEALLEYGVRTVIDMRFPREIAKNPNVFEGSAKVNYLILPLFDDDAAYKVDLVNTLLDQNIFTLEECQPQLRSVFEAIASQPPGVLVHCTVGKDRTGLVVALLLSLANVPHNIIAEDYALSSVYLEPVMKKMLERAIKAGPEVVAKVEPKLTAFPETILDTLAYVEQNYGSVYSYLQAIGIKTEQLAYLRSFLIE